MNNKITIYLSALIIMGLIAQASAFNGVDKDPDFTPSYDWSKHYIELFRQAVKEKYEINDSVLYDRLRTISISVGNMTDGPGYEIKIGLGQIHYLYQVDWAVYNG